MQLKLSKEVGQLKYECLSKFAPDMGVVTACDFVSSNALDSPLYYVVVY